MSRPLWFVEIIKHFFPDRFKIARWTKKSALIRKTVDFFLFKDDQIFYLPKDVVVEDLMKRAAVENSSPTALDTNFEAVSMTVIENSEAEAVSVMEEVRIEIHQDIEQAPSVSLPSSIIRQFIDEANYVWLMDKCLCRDTMQCQDYPIELGCIFMGEAVMEINPKLGHLATKEEAFRRLDLAREHGLVHLIGKNKIDTQWMGVHPGDRLLTVCNCCPCCCLYKVLPDLEDSIGEKIQKMPGLEVIINEEICIGCGKCTEPSVCMTNNLSIIDGKAVMGDYCVGCGRCYEVCPTGAIDIKITDDAYIDETMKRLKSKVDVT